MENEILEFKHEVCIDCGNEFIIAPAEQNYYNEKGFDLPKRCLECRQLRKGTTKIKCVDCGKEVEIPNSRIRYFQLHGLHTPKRCDACYEYKKHRNEALDGQNEA